METVSLKDLLTATCGKIRTPDDRGADFGRVTIDSREVRSGDLFWALRGERHDGHNFVPEAMRRGAIAAVVQRGTVLNTAELLIDVDDTLAALWDFAKWNRRRQTGRVVTVTGSFGKTTTREMIHAALSTCRRGVRSPKNFNNHIGVPLSLLQMERSDDYAVFELAASHIGEICELAQLAQPHIGVITGIGPAHLQSFGTIEQIVAAKSELLEALPEDGLAVLSGDDPVVRGMAYRASCPAVFVGETEDNDVRADNVQVHNDTLRFVVDGQQFELNVVGRHHIGPALAAIAVARNQGLTDRQIADGLHKFRPVAGRCLSRRIGAWTVIDDTYNANPMSCRAACQAVKDWSGANKKWLVLGDMLELGDESSSLHRQLGHEAAASQVDVLLTCGLHAEQVAAGATSAGMHEQDVVAREECEQMFPFLERWIEPGDLVWIKGSRSTHMERVIEWLERISLESPKEVNDCRTRQICV